MQILDPVGSRSLSRPSRGGSNRLKKKKENSFVYTAYLLRLEDEDVGIEQMGKTRGDGGMRDSGRSRAAYTRSDAHRLTEARLGPRQGPGPARVRRLLFCPLLLLAHAPQPSSLLSRRSLHLRTAAFCSTHPSTSRTPLFCSRSFLPCPFPTNQQLLVFDLTGYIYFSFFFFFFPFPSFTAAYTLQY